MLPPPEAGAGWGGVQVTSSQLRQPPWAGSWGCRGRKPWGSQRAGRDSLRWGSLGELCAGHRCAAVYVWIVCVTCVVS